MQQKQVLRDWQRDATVKAVAHLSGEDRHRAACRIYGHEFAEAVLRAAVDPAMTGGWGAGLAADRIEAFIGLLRPKSAAAVLFERSLRVDLTGATTASMPRPASDFPQPQWVAEGDPIPAVAGSFAADQLGPPKKMAILAGLTAEMAQAADAEAVITDSMADAAGRALDATLFSGYAATESRPSGLLASVTPITATTLPTAGAEEAALRKDVRNLAAAIRTAGAGRSILYFAAPPQAVSLELAGLSLERIVAAPSLNDGTVVALDPAAFVHAFNDVPTVDIANSAVVHWEDSAPAQIGTAGMPNVVAAPVRSAFQTHSQALRLILRAAWTMRLPGAVQYLEGAVW